MVQIKEKHSGILWMLLRFMKWMIFTDPLRFFVVFGLRLFTGLVPAVKLVVISKIIQQSIGIYQGAPVDRLLYWIALWAIIILFGHCFTLMETLVTERLRQEMEDSLLRQLHEKAYKLRLEVFERADLHDLLKRAKKMTEPGEFLNLLWMFFSLFSSSLTIASVALVVGRWNIWLLIAILLTALPSPIAQFIQARSMYFVERKQMSSERMLQYVVRLLTSRTAAKELRTFNSAAWLIQKWEQTYWSVAKVLFRHSSAQYLTIGILSIIGVIGLMSGVTWAAWTVATGSLLASQFGAMLYALQSVREGVNSIVGKSGDFRKKLFMIGDLFEYLDLGPEEIKGDRKLLGLGDIRIENMSFHYPQRLEKSLNDITLTIKEGERIAIIGGNGSGKTTLAKVLMGLYRPTEGTVDYGELNIVNIDTNDLTDQSAAVFQDFIRYAFTLKENIAYGRFNLMEDSSAIEEAAVLGGADEIVSALPDGYNTLLTREFSNGTELSGGQWQKVAISRAFMRKAKFIVLDEPTAALDPIAETAVFERFSSVAGTNTAILISHRLGMARLCDRVLVMNGGRIVEQGKHEELIGAGGEYAKMWKIQSQWYA